MKRKNSPIETGDCLPSDLILEIFLPIYSIVYSRRSLRLKEKGPRILISLSVFTSHFFMFLCYRDTFTGNVPQR